MTTLSPAIPNPRLSRAWTDAEAAARVDREAHQRLRSDVLEASRTVDVARTELLALPRDASHGQVERSLTVLRDALARQKHAETALETFVPGSDVSAAHAALEATLRETRAALTARNREVGARVLTAAEALVSAARELQELIALEVDYFDPNLRTPLGRSLLVPSDGKPTFLRVMPDAIGLIEAWILRAREGRVPRWLLE